MVDETAETSAHTIRIKGAAATIHCDSVQKVLFAMEAQIPLPNPRPLRVGCRKGGCGACRVKVVSGEYSTDKMSRAHVTQEEERDGYALACRIYPMSDLEIESAFLGPLGRRENQET